MMGGMVGIRGDDRTGFVVESSCSLDMVDRFVFCPSLLRERIGHSLSSGMRWMALTAFSI